MQIAHTKYGEIEYRLAGQGPRVALLLLGGHVNAAVHLGEDYFIENGYRVIVVSRPGYGKTPLSTGTTPDGFADVLSELFAELAIQKAVVVGVSAGGRTAIRFAAKYPALVEKLILTSAVSFAAWPDWLTRIGTYIGFNPVTEKYTWRLMRGFLKKNPQAALQVMISNLTTLDARQLVMSYDSKELQQWIELLEQMNSGHGFLNDIKPIVGNAADVTVPTLIIHSKYDKSVPLAHARLLAEQIRNSRLYLSEAESHIVWFSSHYSDIKQVMHEFLDNEHISSHTPTDGPTS